MNNIYRLRIDIKKPMNNIIPTFVQYDSAELQIELYNDGERISNISSFDATVSHRLPSGKIFVGEAKVQSESVNGKNYKFLSYEYLGSEMKEVGIVETMATFKAGSSTLSTLPFNVRILYNMNDEYAKEAVSETGYMGQLIQKIEIATDRADKSSKYAREQGDYAKEQAKNIEAQGKYAKEQGDYAKAEREKIIEENINLSKIKQNAKLATKEANNSAEFAKTQGNKAEEQIKRVQPVIDKSEKALKEVENATTHAIEQGDYAKTQTDKVIQENKDLAQLKQKAKEATDKANNSSQLADSKAKFADTKGKYAKEQGDYAKEQGTKTKERTEYLETLLPNIEGWEFKGEWDKNISYEKHNIVTFNGATYILINEEKENNDGFPNTSENWHMLAQRGVDGKGSVRSVNNFLPDENGNINIEFLFEDITAKRDNFLTSDTPPTEMERGVYVFYTTGGQYGYPTYGTVLTVLGSVRTEGGKQFLSSASLGKNIIYARSVVYGKWTNWEIISDDLQLEQLGKLLQKLEKSHNEHIINSDNPHNVTKTQVGLGNVANYKVATKDQAEDATSNNTYMTPLRVLDFLKANGVQSVAGVKRDKGGNIPLTIADLTMDDYLPPTAPPHDYPVGITSFRTNATQAKEWGDLVGDSIVNTRFLVMTIKASSVWQSAQFIFGVDGYANTGNTIRHRSLYVRSTMASDQSTSNDWSDPIKIVDDRDLSDAIKKLTKSDVGLGNVTNVKQASKAEFDEHINDKTNPHNVTSGQVTLIDPKKSSVLMDTYPDGVTMFYYEEDEAEGYPHRIGTVLTAKGVDKTAFQLFARNGFNRASEHIWYRTGHITKGWSDWYQILDEDDLVEIFKKIENVNSEKINTAEDNYLSSDVPLNEYPAGVTVFYKNTSSDVDETNLTNGYPHRYGQVVTFYNGSTTGMQLFTKNNFNETRQEIYIRYWHFNQSKQWSRWFKLLDDRLETKIVELEKEVKELRNAIIQLGGRL